MRLDEKKVILVTGPESSGTRWVARLVGGHPRVLYHRAAGAAEHSPDALAAVWNSLGGEVLPTLPAIGDHDAVVTRRSLPHGPADGGAARFLQFVDLDRFGEACLASGATLMVLVTTRSPAAHLASWTRERASVSRNWQKTVRQYHAAYGHLFSFLGRSGVAFLITSLEGFVLEGPAYLNGIFRLLGLPEHDVPIEPADANLERYEWHRGSGKTL